MKTRTTTYWALWLAAVIGLVISLVYLRARYAAVQAAYRANSAELNTALPGFTLERLEELTSAVRKDTGAVAGLARAFYPKEMWLKKDYDMSILFVEGLNAANQELKKKAGEKNVTPVSLDFASKLPSGDEAVYLLTQLKSLQDLVSLGMDLGCRFVSVKPLAAERVEGIDSVKVIRSSLEGIFPPATVTEFLIRARETAPRVSIEAVDIRKEEDGVRVAMTIGNILSGYGRQNDSPAEAARETSPDEIQRAIALVRSRNPFKSEKPIETAAKPAAGPEAEAKPARRFFYRGKAMLRGAEVAVIEDALAHETVFLKVRELYGNMRVKSFSADDAVLENIDDGVTTTVKRGE